MKGKSFQAKLTLLFISLVTVVLLVTVLVSFRRDVRMQKQDLSLRILGMARLASLYLDAETLMQIKPELASENAPVYKEIQNTLIKLKNVTPFVDSIYTMIKSDQPDKWVFLVDSGDKRKVVARCGEKYDVSKYPDMRVAFERPSVDKELTTDKYGVFLSAYAPIYDKNGKAQAIIGIDIRAEAIRAMQLMLLYRFIGILIFGIALSIFFGWIFGRRVTGPVRSLMEGVRELGKGNLEYRVDIRTKDELQELAEAFNKMSDELGQEKQKLQRYYIETVKSLIRALEAKDHYTSGHSERVAHYAMRIAKHMGLPDKDIKLLEEVSVLHDIGKMGMPEEILGKNGPLTTDERKIIEQHPSVGEDILRPIEFLKPGLSAVSDHHERQDGSGYPHGLKGEQISLFVAIAAVADSYDAMTSDRPYRKALTQEEAIQVLEKNKGTQFDARVVEAFVEHLKELKSKT